MTFAGTNIAQALHIQAAYEANRNVYSSPGVHAELRAQGVGCSRKHVARLIRMMGLVARRPRRWTRPPRAVPDGESFAQSAEPRLYRQSPQPEVGGGYHGDPYLGGVVVQGLDP